LYRELRDTLAAKPTLTDDELRECIGYDDELTRLERIHRAEIDLLYFSYEYFGEIYNPDNSGNWIPVEIAMAPDFHRQLCGLMDDVSMVNRNAKIAWAAPRSHAKSSFLSKSSPAREIAYRKRKYIIVISETPTVAVGNLDWLATQLRSNEKFRRDFGPLLHIKQQMNPKDNSSEFIAWEPTGDGGQRLLTKVEASSSNQALRGRNWNGVRPDLVICDDLEGKKNTNTPELRKELRDWFTQVVMPLGDPSGKKTAFVVMGTMVHQDSLLRHIMTQRSDFKSRLFRALIDEPDRMDLWQRCQTIYQDRENPNRADEALSFYADNKDEMDRGAVVLWPDVQPLWALMVWKWDNGSKAFSTEYQNNPIDEESAVFRPEQFFYFAPAELDTHECDFYGAWDIAFGKSNRSDYNAIVTIARHRKTGVLYVWDVWMAKCPAHEALKVAVDKIAEFDHRSFVVETVGGQIDLARQLKDALRQERLYRTRLVEIATKRKKEERIESLEPLTQNGTLQFRRDHRLLLEMFVQYPSHNHDDGPDALAYAVDVASKPPRRVREKPSYL
jgi:predicted phage terminase large subunit-like protein